MSALHTPVFGAFLVLLVIVVFGVGGAFISRTYRHGQTPWALYIGAFLAVLGVLVLMAIVAGR